MPPPSLVTNKKLSGQAREMLNNVIKYFEKEKLHQAPLVPLDKCIKRAAVATGVSIRTVERIRSEAKRKELSDQPWSTPDKTRTVKGKLGKLNELELCAARRIIQECVEKDGNNATLNKICEAIKTELELDISTSTCRRLIRNLGFGWKTSKPVIIETDKSFRKHEEEIIEDTIVYREYF